VIPAWEAAGESVMMGQRQDRDQGQLFYEFNLDEMIPTDYLLVAAQWGRVVAHGGPENIAAIRPPRS